MSQLQRIVVRQGLAAQIPALIMGELGWDIDTFTLRVGDDTDDPVKIMTTKSRGIFDFRSATKVYLPDTEIDNLAGIDLSGLYAEPGIMVSTGDPNNFKHVSIYSSDSSVIITNGDGQTGDKIDLRVSTESISEALKVIQQQLNDHRDALDYIDGELFDHDDSISRLYTLLGRPLKQTNLGTFTGEIIPDGVSVKVALQSLETFSEELADLIAAGSVRLIITDRTAYDIDLAIDNGSPSIALPAASDTQAGLMTAADKAKSNKITMGPGSADLSNFDDWKEAVDTKLDTHDLKIHDLENALSNMALSGAMFFKDIDNEVWVSSEDEIYVELDIAQYEAFSIVYNRVGNGHAGFKYNEIRVNGIIVVHAEYPISSYTDRIVVFKKADNWYWLKDSIAIQIPISGTKITVNASNNTVVVRQLNLT